MIDINIMKSNKRLGKKPWTDDLAQVTVLLPSYILLLSCVALSNLALR